MTVKNLMPYQNDEDSPVYQTAKKMPGRFYHLVSFFLSPVIANERLPPDRTLFFDLDRDLFLPKNFVSFDHGIGYLPGTHAVVESHTFHGAD